MCQTNQLYRVSVLLSAEQFKTMNVRACTYYGQPEEAIQIRYYYDTEQHQLQDTRQSLLILQTETEMTRIRQFYAPLTKWIWQLREQTHLVQEVTNSIKAIDISRPLSLCGSMATQRRTYRIPFDLLLHLDVNEYWGCCDYEMTLETKSLDNEDLERVLGYMDFDRGEYTSPKANRFFTVVQK